MKLIMHLLNSVFILFWKHLRKSTENRLNIGFLFIRTFNEVTLIDLMESIAAFSNEIVIMHHKWIKYTQSSNKILKFLIIFLLE